MIKWGPADCVREGCVLVMHMSTAGEQVEHWDGKQAVTEDRAQWLSDQRCWSDRVRVHRYAVRTRGYGNVGPVR